MSETGTQQATQEHEIRVVDFTRPQRIPPEQMKVLTAMHEALAEALGAMLSSRLQTAVGVSLTATGQQYTSACLGSLAVPSCIHVFRMTEPAGSGVLVMSPKLALSMVSRLLGGPVAAADSERAVTRIEQRVLGVMVERILAALTAAWQATGSLVAVPGRFETEPGCVQITGPGESLLTVTFEIALAGQQFPLMLWLPVTPLEPLLSRLAVPPAAVEQVRDAAAWPDDMVRRLESVPVAVRCVLGDSLITLRELMDLAPGDILHTSVSVQDEVAILVGDRARFRGRPGIANGRVALSITQIASQEEQGA
jgi:flagellar motor switch protein FliM